MNIERANPVNETLAKLIFLILPTAAIGYFLLQHVSEYYSLIQNQSFQQTLYFGGGMAVACLFYSFRFRFLPTYIILIAALFSIYKGIGNYGNGEFDTFFAERRFQMSAILLSLGWLIGWGFTRLRYWSVGIAASLLASCIALLAKSKAPSVDGFLASFTPALLYSVYIIFTAEQIYNYKDKSAKFWWFLTRRIIFFSALAALLLTYIAYRMRPEIKEAVENFGGGGKEGKGGMLKENKDGTFDLKDYSRLSSSLSRSKQLLFCAHIDNFFPGTDIPNPLYLTAFYFTKFDTLTETFERDSTIPYNDLFEPNPSKIPLFYTSTDSSVIKNSMGEKLRTTVEVEIYNKMLSPNTYMAPNVGFFVQPIAVEKDFRSEFKSAFRTKSYVSLLNSAYFVYNVQNPQIQKFQEQRFEVLRKVDDYSHMDSKFMRYYTFMPGNEKFKSIGELAHKITDTAHTPVDKVLAIRNYFLSKDEHGERLYQYTDNPGIPDLPNASKLLYFMNENHKGYCAYFAGATLFMLRSLGIPSRIAVGFLTEERSDKNKGWYWYYANQAHAWVQVYFPGYGWLDFDTTVGNDNENRPTPQPDGTPPMQPPKAWLAADGLVVDVDTVKKTMRLAVKQMVFHDREYKLDKPDTITADMKVAALYRDSIAIPLASVQKGDEGTAVSYAEALKKMLPGNTESAASLINRFPSPTPVDEVYLKRKDIAKLKEKQELVAQAKPVTLRFIMWLALGIFSALTLLLLMVPRLILAYYKARYRKTTTGNNKAYWGYRAATYYMHMCGIYRNSLTPMQFAKDIVDPLLGTSFTRFMNVYLKTKYAKQALTPTEDQYVSGFLLPFLSIVKLKVKFSNRFFGLLNPVRCISFFVMPDDEE